MDINSIIIGPIISEKSMSEAGKGKFTFAVIKYAGKNAIKKAINNTFKVNVVSIRTTLQKGKRKRVGARRTQVQGSFWKKAVVVLKSGEKIDIFAAAEQSSAKSS